MYFCLAVVIFLSVCLIYLLLVALSKLSYKIIHPNFLWNLIGFFALAAGATAALSGVLDILSGDKLTAAHWSIQVLYSIFIAILLYIIVLRPSYEYHKEVFNKQSLLDNSAWSSNPVSPINNLEQLLGMYGYKEDDLHNTAVLSNYYSQLIKVQSFIEGGGKSNLLAVTGRWRSGKTSAVNIALDMAKVNNRDLFMRVSCLNYTKSVDSLIKDVVFDISVGVRKKWGVDISKELSAMGDNMSPQSIGPVDHLISYSNVNRQTVSHLILNKINRKLRNTNGSLYIIIDDVDRLVGDEVRHMLSFMHTLASISIVKQIVCIEWDATIHNLAEAGVYQPESYINKFIDCRANSIHLSSQYEMIEKLALNRIKDIVQGKVDDEMGLRAVWAVCLLKIFDRLAKSPAIKGDPVTAKMLYSSPVGDNWFKPLREYYGKHSLIGIYAFIRRSSTRIKKSGLQGKFNKDRFEGNTIWKLGDVDFVNRDNDTDEKIQPYSMYIDAIFDIANKYWDQFEVNIYDEINNFCDVISGIDKIKSKDPDEIFNQVFKFISEQHSA